MLGQESVAPIYVDVISLSYLIFSLFDDSHLLAPK